MPFLRVITHEFEIVSDTVTSELIADPASLYEWTVSCDPSAEELEEGLTPARMAAAELQWLPASFEPDVMPGTPSWYCGRDGDLEGVEFIVTLEGFTPGARDRIEQLRNPSRKEP